MRPGKIVIGWIALALMVAVWASSTNAQQGAMVLDQVRGANVYDSTQIPTGRTISFDFRIQNNYGDYMIGAVHPFVLYTPDGAAWTPANHINLQNDTSFYGTFVDPPEIAPLVWCCTTPSIMGYAAQALTFSDHDSNTGTPDLFGSGRDTIVFAALVGSSPTSLGIPNGFDYIGMRLSFTIEDTTAIGKTICVDTTKKITSPPFAWTWGWESRSGPVYKPDWAGPRCFEIVDCCLGMRGNVDGDLSDEVSIPDLTTYVSWAYKGGATPPCMAEVDVNGDGSVDTADLGYLVAFMFKGGSAPVACP